MTQAKVNAGTGHPSTSQRPRYPRLGSRELVAYVERTLPYALVVTNTGTAWVINRLHRPLARRSKLWEAWSGPERWPDKEKSGPKRTDIIATIPLYSDHALPWDSYDALDAADYLASVFLGVDVCKDPRRTRERRNRFAIKSDA
jgi:hypothetical protein